MYSQSEAENYKLQTELLQEKLQNSERQRMKLEKKLGEIMESRKSHEKTDHIRKQYKYNQLMEELMKRQERNKSLVNLLDRIDQQMTKLSHRSECLKMIKDQHELFFSKLLQSQTQQNMHELNPAFSSAHSITVPAYLTSYPDNSFRQIQNFNLQNAKRCVCNGYPQAPPFKETSVQSFAQFSKPVLTEIKTNSIEIGSDSTQTPKPTEMPLNPKDPASPHVDANIVREDCAESNTQLSMNQTPLKVNEHNLENKTSQIQNNKTDLESTQNTPHLSSTNEIDVKDTTDQNPDVSGVTDNFININMNKSEPSIKEAIYSMEGVLPLSVLKQMEYTNNDLSFEPYGEDNEESKRDGNYGNITIPENRNHGIIGNDESLKVARNETSMISSFEQSDNIQNKYTFVQGSNQNSQENSRYNEIPRKNEMIPDAVVPMEKPTYEHFDQDEKRLIPPYADTKHDQNESENISYKHGNNDETENVISNTEIINYQESNPATASIDKIENAIYGELIDPMKTPHTEQSNILKTLVEDAQTTSSIPDDKYMAPDTTDQQTLESYMSNMVGSSNVQSLGIDNKTEFVTATNNDINNQALNNDNYNQANYTNYNSEQNYANSFGTGEGSQDYQNEFVGENSNQQYSNQYEQVNYPGYIFDESTGQYIVDPYAQPPYADSDVYNQSDYNNQVNTYEFTPQNEPNVINNTVMEPEPQFQTDNQKPHPTLEPMQPTKIESNDSFLSENPSVDTQEGQTVANAEISSLDNPLTAKSTNSILSSSGALQHNESQKKKKRVNFAEVAETNDKVKSDVDLSETSENIISKSESDSLNIQVPT